MVQWGLWVAFSIWSVALEGPQSADGRTWEQTHNADGIQTFQLLIPGTSYFALKGHAEIPASPAKVLSILTDQAHALQWFEDLQDARVLERRSAFEYVEYRLMGTPIFVKDRDFVVRVKIEPNPRDNSVKLTARSILHQRAPATEAIRGEILYAHFVLKSGSQDGTTSVDAELHVDPKGSVPAFFVNWYQRSWARKTLEALRRQAERKDLGVQREFDSLLK